MKDIRRRHRLGTDQRRCAEEPGAPGKLYWVIFIHRPGHVQVGGGLRGLPVQHGPGLSANLDNPHVWGLYIATFIFWIGMSHSGTLLSAILHIMHADWRKPIYRFAEAMTTFSLMTAGLFVAGASRAACGSSTTPSPTRTSAGPGRTSSRRCCGTRWRSAPT